MAKEKGVIKGAKDPSTHREFFFGTVQDKLFTI